MTVHAVVAYTAATTEEDSMRRGFVRVGLLGLCVCGCPSLTDARQTPDIDLSVGYGQLRVLGFQHRGVAGQIHVPFTDLLGVEAYMSRYWDISGNPFGVNTLGGRVTFRDVHPRVTPYAAFGLDFFDIGISTIGKGVTRQTGWSAVRIGGGTDVGLTRTMALRFDSRFTPLRLFQDLTGDYRWRAGMDFSVGVAFRLPWSVR
jgi:hypothetical protein